jgi:ribulose-5-phosphate 4-epimerase/fuculose-1-phosphate aldolase
MASISLASSSNAAGSSAKFPADEWQARMDLAACYRLVHHFGWTDMVSTHISARVPGKDDVFLISPHGLLFDEVTASSLVKVDVEGKVLDNPEARINRAGFVIHSAIHMGCPDAHFALHTHTVAGIAVATQKDGLLPISFASLTVLGDVAYYDGDRLPGELSERETMSRVLGSKRILVMRNHGLLTVGRNAGESFMAMWRMQRACEIQIASFQQSGSGFHAMSHEVMQNGTERGMKAFWKGGTNDPVQLEWPALLRRMDRIDPSYKE